MEDIIPASNQIKNSAASVGKSHLFFFYYT